MITKKFSHRQRRQTGSGIVEGVIGLFLVVLGVTGGSLLLANIGVAMSYQEKLTHITAQAADYAAAQGDPSTATVKPFVDMLLGKVGLPPSQSVTVQSDTTNNTATVSVVLSGLKLVGSGTILPAFLSSLSDTEVSANSGKPVGWVTLSGINPNGGTNNACLVGGVSGPQVMASNQMPVIPVYAGQPSISSIVATNPSGTNAGKPWEMWAAQVSPGIGSYNGKPFIGGSF